MHQGAQGAIVMLALAPGFSQSLAVFELQDVSLLVDAKPQELVLVGNVTASLPPGELVALVGLPGSGKSILLKLLAGVCPPTFGELGWSEYITEGENAETPRIAYLPQESHSAVGALSLFTVTEHVSTALRLRVAGVDKAACAEQVAALLELTGLTSVATRRPDALSIPQRQRLALAVELTSSPALLLCDAANEALPSPAELAHAKFLRSLTRQEPRAIVHVTHALDSLGEYDSVMVMHGGQLAYHGPPEFLAHYFQIPATEALYEHLATLPPAEAHRSWVKLRKTYQSPQGRAQIAGKIGEEERRQFLEKMVEAQSRESKPAPRPPGGIPGAFAQFCTLLGRRWRLAAREISALWLQLALFFGFPFAVVLFATGALGDLQKLSRQLTGNVAELLKEDPVFAVLASHGCELVAGLAITQVLFLGIMAANNAAREIAGERMAFEGEKQGGLRTGAYLASKAAFLLPVVLVQSAWMGFYVNSVCRLPGNLWEQIAVLSLANAALTALSLAVSSLVRATPRALLVCLCIAVLQLPLSGVVLEPPSLLIWVLRPLVTLYWGASAYIQTMLGTRFYEVFPTLAARLPLSPALLCGLLLGFHIALSLTLAFYGCKIGRLGVTRKHSGT